MQLNCVVSPISTILICGVLMTTLIVGGGRVGITGRSVVGRPINIICYDNNM